MKLETFEAVTALLPSLVDRTGSLASPGELGCNPIECQRRYHILNQIEGLLRRDGLSWNDLAAQIMPPAHRPGDLLNMTAAILQSGQHLTEHAKDFLAGLRDHARRSEGEPVYLTLRQSEWLRHLHARALHLRTQPQQPDGAVSNVVFLRGQVGTGSLERSETNGQVKGSA